MKHVRMRLGAVAFVLLVLFLLSGAHLCGVASEHSTDLGSRPIEKSAIACTEFWLNRYQTLIGAIVALGAALYAGNWVRKQIIAAEKQTQLTRIQVAFDSLPRLYDRIASANDIFARYESLVKIGRSCEIDQLKIISDLRELLNLTIDERIAIGVNNKYKVIEDAHRLRDKITQNFRERDKIVGGVDLNKYPATIRDEFANFSELLRGYLAEGAKFYEYIIDRRSLQVPSTIYDQEIDNVEKLRPASGFVNSIFFEETFTQYKRSAQKLYDLTVRQTDELFEIDK